MTELQIHISHDATAVFCALLNERDIPFENRTPKPRPGMVFAAGADILGIIGDATPYVAALAYVISTWIKANSRRKVIITTTRLVETRQVKTDAGW